MLFHAAAGAAAGGARPLVMSPKGCVQKPDGTITFEYKAFGTHHAVPPKRYRDLMAQIIWRKTRCPFSGKVPSVDKDYESLSDAARTRALPETDTPRHTVTEYGISCTYDTVSYTHLTLPTNREV